MSEKSINLRRITLFSGLSDAALEQVAVLAAVQSYAPGTLVILEGDPCEAVYLIVAGRVRVSRLSPQGREQVFAQLETGQVFNTVPPFQPQGRNHASVVALTAVTLYVIFKDDFLRLVQHAPEVSLRILQDFAGRLHHLTGLVEDLALRSVRSRLARFLLARDGHGEESQRWTQDEIAIHIGSVRDVVGRSLRAFADAGLIRLGRGRITLLDRDALAEEAQF